MAYEPIVLGSNLTSSGALGGFQGNRYLNPDASPRDQTVENEDGTFTIPTYKSEVIDLPSDFDFTMYGTKYAPMLRYFNQVRTGEIQYNPEDDRIDPETVSDFTGETGISPEEAIKQELIGVGTQLAAGIGGQIGRSVADNVTGEGFNLGDISEGISDFGSKFEALDLIRAPKTGPASKVRFSPGTDNADVASLNKTISDNKVSTADALLDPEGAKANIDTAKQAATTRAGLLETGDTGIFSGIQDRGDIGLFGGEMSAAGRANLYGAAGAGMATIAAGLISGQSLKESVKTGAKVSAGKFIGETIGGPIGGLIGGVLGGRVICNELMRQGIMTRKQVVLDYKFTQDYLSPQHVAGYHIWAVWMVRQMRKGRLVNFWSHVAGHRANEIAYIYGERDKPDYLGKLYRKILEPICWSIGFLCKKTDWTILYKEKEI